LRASELSDDLYLSDDVSVELGKLAGRNPVFSVKCAADRS
jgi:hypothetical protein